MFSIKINSTLITWASGIVLCIACHAKSICIDDAQEYAILDQFFRMTFSSEEYGYVLEGCKPISIRNFLALDSFPVSKDLAREEKEFNNAILVRQVIPLWHKFCGQQKNFVLKVIATNNQTAPFLSTLEVAFINVAKLQDVVEKNIDLFHYILGPTHTVQGIVDSLVNSKKSLNEILNHDLTLTGIVLGFGSHNSIVGGRQETICALSISKDCPPFSPQSYVMQGGDEHSLDFLTPERYGAYYLELAGGDDINFRIDTPRLRPQSGYINLIEEVRSIDQLEEHLLPALYQEPMFIFGAFKGGTSNRPLFKQLREAQKKIQSLLNHPLFLERILEKINKGRVKKTISKHPSSAPTELPPNVWNEILHRATNRFTDEEKKSAFIQAFNHPNNNDCTPPMIMGASKAVLEGLKKAKNHLAQAELQFEKLSQDSSLQELVLKRLYFKTVFPGGEQKIEKENRVRVSFVIEDSAGTILFANNDIWINLSETFSGFAHGLQGMHVQEKRILSVHPALAYGALTTLPPCTSLTVHVQLLDIDPQSPGILPPLRPLDLNWIQSAAFYKHIEESLTQHPRFAGFFYREMFNKMNPSNADLVVLD